MRWVFASCGQDAFFEGHVHAFRMLGGVLRGRIRYDNLRAAVERVLGFSRAGVESDQWTAFRCCTVPCRVQQATEDRLVVGNGGGHRAGTALRDKRYAAPGFPSG